MSKLTDNGVLKWPASIPARFQTDIESLKTWFNSQIAKYVLSGRTHYDFWEQGWIKAWLHICLTSELPVVDLAKSLGWEVDPSYYLSKIQRNFCVRPVSGKSVFKVEYLPGFRTSRPAKLNNRDFQRSLKGKSRKHKVRDILLYTDFGGDWNLPNVDSHKPNLDYLELVKAANAFKLFGMPDIYVGDYAVMQLIGEQFYVLTSSGNIFYWTPPSEATKLEASECNPNVLWTRI